jgi:LDH2 family malate/lactate/ureidoglycolate dehydrogenase
MTILGPELVAGSTRVPATTLTEFSTQMFQVAGLSAPDAATAAGVLINADLRGVWSHGVIRLPMYIQRLQNKVANSKPNIQTQQMAHSAVSVDGDHGLGLVVAPAAMSATIKLAKQTGIAVAGVKNSGHFGAASYYLQQAIDADCIGLVFTNASKALPPWGAMAPFFGTSPFGFAAPTYPGEVFMLDMAMSRIARGKLKFAAQRGEQIPLGFALDTNGRPTTDGAAGFEGIMLPFGEHKGAAMSWMMDILGGVFTGAAFGGDVANPFKRFDVTQGVGHTFIAIRADLFQPLMVFKDRMSELLKRVKNLPKAHGVDEVLSPGEPENRKALLNLQQGVPLTRDVIESLNSAAQRLGVAQLVL